jgi:hypothetical protein
MGKVMTEDVVNEICKACIEALGKPDTFSIFEGEIRQVYDDYDVEDVFSPYGEPILVGDLDLSIEARSFLSDITWFQDDMALVFVVENDTIEMHLCSDSCGSFQPELTFTFKKTFDDLFD